ncbi:ATP-binding cassette domain-containing protein [Paenibacillus sp. GP183]|uniref:phosphonate C-P lyase system protein PhnL n=1 Tax=Paenibacillus sp. GP183 TaxID=1882751 RepID=UPI000894C342|nr:ATP-binding cassette domain-containing protein [Paenibacillus sp. GP183]SEC62392.1 alpha-D-ribose 1-methylphosphonate 5-triphosphate synthase subunit PhnL [Paenibacillus sp. GP183]
MLLEVRNLQKTFLLYQQVAKNIVGCRDVNLTLHDGEFIGITGKSGVGKSTILKCLYRTYLSTGGQILFRSGQFGTIDLAQASEQQIIEIRKKEIGYVSQFLSVLPRVTAFGVVKEAFLETGVGEEAAAAESETSLSFFELPQTLWDAYPGTFSGGEKLRLNLARAMVKRPKLLLLDEPTASLDNRSKEAVKEMILRLKQGGTSMVGIFHDLDFMQQVIDKHYAMENGVMMERTIS